MKRRSLLESSPGYMGPPPPAWVWLVGGVVAVVLVLAMGLAGWIRP